MSELVVQNYSPAMSGQIFTYDGHEYHVLNNKLFRGNDVAVVYSPGYGGGFSTWCDVDPTDARFAVLTLTGGSARLFIKDGDEERTVAVRAGKFYLYEAWLDTSRGEDLVISWLPAGTMFRVEEYDGAEYITTAAETNWNIA